jgi:TfoX/Sxy family transcriptional regulator of competence genes
MFSLLTNEGMLALRLPKDELVAFREKYGTEPVVQYGAVMKEYAAVPNTLLQDTAELKKYFDISYAYTGSLKPKPTKKK